MVAEFTKTFTLPATGVPGATGVELLTAIQIGDVGDVAGTKYVIKYLSLNASNGFAVYAAQTYSVVQLLTDQGVSQKEIFVKNIPAVLPGANVPVEMINTNTFQTSLGLISKEAIIDQQAIQLGVNVVAGNVTIVISFIKITAQASSPFLSSTFTFQYPILPAANTANVILLANATAPGTTVYVIKSINLNAFGISYASQLHIGANGFLTGIVPAAATLNTGLSSSVPIYLDGGSTLYLDISNYIGAAGRLPTAYISYNVSV